jgi:hypothetical protein
MKRAILEELNSCHPRLEPEGALYSGVLCRVKNPCTLTEMRAKAKAMEAEGLVASVTSELDDVVRYRITDAGRALLAS